MSLRSYDLRVWVLWFLHLFCFWANGQMQRMQRVSTFKDHFCHRKKRECANWLIFGLFWLSTNRLYWPSVGQPSHLLGEKTLLVGFPVIDMEPLRPVICFVLYITCCCPVRTRKCRCFRYPMLKYISSNLRKYFAKGGLFSEIISISKKSVKSLSWALSR